MTLAKYNAPVAPMKPSEKDTQLMVKQIKQSIDANLSIHQSRANLGGGNITTVCVKSDDSTQHIARIAEKKLDPFDPSRFRNRKVLQLQQDDPDPILIAPPKKLTAEEQKYWDVPPVISNWKNPSGHVIPIDKRLAADGRRNEQPQLSDRFAPFARALEATLSSINEQANQHALIQRQLRQKKEAEEQERAQEEIRRLREEQRAIKLEKSSEERGRDRALDSHRKERERLRRQMTDRRRDVSERVALGQALGAQTADEQFDSSVFSSGARGIAAADAEADEYAIYDEPLLKRPPERPQVALDARRFVSDTRAEGVAGAGAFRISFRRGATQEASKKEGLQLPEAE